MRFMYASQNPYSSVETFVYDRVGSITKLNGIVKVDSKRCMYDDDLVHVVAVRGAFVETKLISFLNFRFVFHALLFVQRLQDILFGKINVRQYAIRLIDYGLDQKTCDLLRVFDVPQFRLQESDIGRESGREHCCDFTYHTRGTPPRTHPTHKTSCAPVSSSKADFQATRCFGPCTRRE